VGFECRVKGRVITGEVQEKEQARQTFQNAVDRGEVAGLLEQLPDASDVFTTTIGNVPPESTVYVEITYLGELKHDAEVDGLRFTIPTFISPRYGSYPGGMASDESSTNLNGKFEVTVDTLLDEGSVIREIRSPSHPIAVSMGMLSTDPEGTPSLNQSSATLSLGSSQLDGDFVLQVVSKEIGTPTALLEDHPRIPGQKALMATLVPKFELQTQRPEIVFVCDRSGSMDYGKIEALKSALKVFLKSLPVGVVFNICSFGSRHDYLWPKSKAYNQETMEKAMKHVETFSANYGGTEMLEPIKDTLTRRHPDRSLEVFLVTDGQIWDQQSLFDHLNYCIKTKKQPVRVFTLGIGDGVSHSLIEGVARCGNGFCQSVGETEKMDSKVVRMLKGALFPQITDYTLEVKYGAEESEDDDFEMVDKVSDSLKVEMDPKGAERKVVRHSHSTQYDSTLISEQSPVRKVISLFDPNANPDADIKKGEDPFKYLPKIPSPKMLQAPNEIPPLFPFNRTTVYLLLAPGTKGIPKSVVLRGTSPDGPVELEIPIQHLAQPGESIHQLAARKAILELEEGHGWVHSAKIKNKSLKTEFPSYMDEIVRREAVRLGVQFQVAGKYCSFVAVEKKAESDEKPPEEFEFLDDEIDKLTLVEDQGAEIYADDQYGESFRRSGGAMNISVNKPIKMAKSGSLVRGLGAGGLGGAVASAFGAMSPRKKSSSKVFGSSSAAPPPPPSVAAPAFYGMAPMAPGGPDRSPAMEATVSMVQTQDGMLDKISAKTNGYINAPKPKPSRPGRAMARMSSIAKEEKASKPLVDMSDGAFSEVSEVREEGGKGSSDVLHILISLQKFEGCWIWEKALWTLLKVDPKKADEMAPKMDKRHLATALAIKYFETKLSSEKDTWELVVDKAYDWLASNPGPEKGIVMKVADELLG
jgi:von Willebrand factor type A domain/Vault protein inter-alpha-trypsin domain